MSQDQIERVALAIDDDLARQVTVQSGCEYERADECGVALASMNIVVSEVARAAIEALQPDIRDEALEEAAQVADECVTEAHQQQRKSDEYGDALGGQLASARFRLSTEIAKAIRSLKGSERHG